MTANKTPAFALLSGALLSSAIVIQGCSEYAKQPVVDESESKAINEEIIKLNQQVSPKGEGKVEAREDVLVEGTLVEGALVKGEVIKESEAPADLRKRQLREEADSASPVASAQAKPGKSILADAAVSLPAPIAVEQVAGTLMEKKKESLYVGGLATHISQPTSIDAIRMPSESLDRESYQDIEDNSIKLVSDEPVSTFSIDVDTASYANVRRFLNNGRLPATDAVRVEEMINYFDYDYPLPESTEVPFSINTELTASPWNANTQLLRVGIQGYEQDVVDMPPANLVFLIDVSGSMQSQKKLPLLKKSMSLLTDNLRPQDTLSIAVYAGASGIALEPTSGKEKAKIKQAIQRLSAGGSTNGAAGIRLAYQLAEQAFDENGVNRVILATDGDFNVGTVNHEALKDLITEKRKSNVFLSVLGFGTGNYNDRLMEDLSNIGNGNASYIDSFNEARKVLVNEISGTLQTIAKDVKIQVEFNPKKVSEYRLIGYENRMLNREDFNNDKVDAGEIGAGHTVTALYEITPVGALQTSIDPLRYQNSALTIRESVDSNEGNTAEVAFVKVRYKQPAAKTSQLVTQPIFANSLRVDFNSASTDMRFSSAVAGFGQLLRGGKHTQSFSLNDVHTIAVNARGKDAFGYRGEFIQLVLNAKSLSGADKLATNIER